MVEGAFVVHFHHAGEDDVERGEDETANDGIQNAVDPKEGQQIGGDDERERVDEEPDDEDGDEAQRPSQEQHQRPN